MLAAGWSVQVALQHAADEVVLPRKQHIHALLLTGQGIVGGLHSHHPRVSSRGRSAGDARRCGDSRQTSTRQAWALTLSQDCSLLLIRIAPSSKENRQQTSTTTAMMGPRHTGTQPLSGDTWKQTAQHSTAQRGTGATQCDFQLE